MRLHFGVYGSDAATGALKQEVRQLLLPRENTLYHLKGWEPGMTMESINALPNAGDQAAAHMLLMATGEDPFLTTATPDVGADEDSGFQHLNMRYDNIVAWWKWGVLNTTGTGLLTHELSPGGDWHPLDELVTELFFMGNYEVHSVTMTLEYRMAVQYDVLHVSNKKWLEVRQRWGLDRDATRPTIV